MLAYKEVTSNMVLAICESFPMYAVWLHETMCTDLYKVFDVAKRWTVSPCVLSISGRNLPVFNASLVSEDRHCKYDHFHTPYVCVYVCMCFLNNYQRPLNIYTNTCQALGSGPPTAHKHRQNKSVSVCMPSLTDMRTQTL